MFKLKLLISIVIFIFLLIGTSSIKNKTRELEKKIIFLNKNNFQKEKDLNEVQLDFYYLTSPSIIERKVKHLGIQNYIPMQYSNIFLSLNHFLDLQKKYVIQEKPYEKKIQKK